MGARRRCRSRARSPRSHPSTLGRRGSFRRRRWRGFADRAARRVDTGSAIRLGDRARAMAGAKPLWKCPKCGVSLVVRNLSHACGDYSVAKFLKGKSEPGRALFAKFEALIARCGPYEVAPAKTRVAFLARVRFASVNRVGKDAIDVHFVLPRALASRRFRRVEKVGNVWVHHLR